MISSKDFESIFPEISVVGFYTLCGKYDRDMGQLYSELKDLLFSKFGDSEIYFTPNERIIFLHNDLDFFINSSSPGFTLYNLQLILRELNIPNYFCAVISNLPNYNYYTELAAKQLTSDPVPLRGISSHYFNLTRDINDINTNNQLISKPFTVLSRLARFHRTFFMSKFFDAKLENEGFVAYHNINATSDNEDTNYTPVIQAPNCHFIYSTPFTRNNPEMIIQSVENQQIFNRFAQSVDSFKNFTEHTNILDKSECMNLQNNILQQSLIYVGLETTINCPEVYISEISWKGILAKRPFILFAVPGTIKYLQSLGFKTFNDFWDEGYDNIINFEDRVDAIINLLQIYKNLTAIELQNLLTEMQSIVNYNFDHLTNNLICLEKLKISKGLLT